MRWPITAYRQAGFDFIDCYYDRLTFLPEWGLATDRTAIGFKIEGPHCRRAGKRKKTSLLINNLLFC
jgi:hypothetical protein